MRIDTPKIFVIETDALFTNVMKNHFITSGYHDIEIFLNAENCLDSLNFNPDIIIINSIIGSLDNFTFIRSVKKITPNVPIIFLVDDNESAEIESLSCFGIYDIIEKKACSMVRLTFTLRHIVRLTNLMNEKSHTNFWSKIAEPGL